MGVFMSESKKTNNVRLAVLEEQYQHIDEKISEIHKILVGNGNPGLSKEVNELCTNQSNHKKVLDKHSDIIDKLNIRMAMYGGGIGIIVFIMQLIAAIIS